MHAAVFQEAGTKPQRSGRLSDTRLDIVSVNSWYDKRRSQPQDRLFGGYTVPKNVPELADSRRKSRAVWQ